MGNNELIISQKNEIKASIMDFMETLDRYAIDKQLAVCNQADKNFYSFISKQIFFLRNMYEFYSNDCNYNIKVLISDFYNLITCIMENQHRYIYLNERSIIENYVRWIVKTDVESNHVTNNVFEKFKTYSPLTAAEFALIKNEYTTSCGYIHGSMLLNDSLSCVFNDCVSNFAVFKNKNCYYIRLTNIIKAFNRLLISTYYNDIDNAFHRRKTILEYLIGKPLVDDLFRLI